MRPHRLVPTLQLTVMFDTAGRGKGILECMERHRLPPSTPPEFVEHVMCLDEEIRLASIRVAAATVLDVSFDFYTSKYNTPR